MDINGRRVRPYVAPYPFAERKEWKILETVDRNYTRNINGNNKEKKTPSLFRTSLATLTSPRSI